MNPWQILVAIVVALILIFGTIVFYNNADEHRRTVCYEQTHSTAGC